jgi:hypothetical protein
MTTFRLLEVIVRPMQNPEFIPLKTGLRPGKAYALLQKLEGRNSQAEFDPNRLVSYLAEPEVKS